MSNILNNNQVISAYKIYPYGVAEHLLSRKRSVVTLYNNQVISLETLEKSGIINTNLHTYVFDKSTLNFFASKGTAFENHIQSQLRELFSDNNFESLPAKLKAELTLEQAKVKLLCPFKISDFADFFACRNHAENASKIFLGDSASLNLNWKSMPIGYYGRSSSVTCGNNPIKIPFGNILNSLTGKVEYLNSNMVDFEVELGFFIGKSSYQKVVSTKNAADHIFGVVLLNDWSARDIQAFESQPLGPFLSKSFATTISPWVFSYQALQPFMRPIENPPFAMKHLREFESRVPEIEFTVTLKTLQSTEPVILSKINSSSLSWSLEQITTHIASNGGTLNTGDLIGTGTISGTVKQELGCLLEITKNGKFPINLPNNEQRRYLQKGDSLTISACCRAEGIYLDIGSITNTIK